MDLWNAPDNAAVRSRVAAADLEAAGITSLTFDGPGRVCYVTVFDAAKHARGTYVIWPDNLFDNGSLHEYAEPFVMETGFERQEIELVPSLHFASDGRLP